MDIEMMSFWESWFGIHAGREVLVKNSYGEKDYVKRVFLDNSLDLADYVAHQEQLNQWAYMSVQPYTGNDKVWGLEHLFFDFDYIEDPGKAVEEAKDFAHIILKYYHAKTLLVKSGRKGCHVYVWLWQPVTVEAGETDIAKRIYGLLQRKLLKGLEYMTIDTSVIGDIKRLARIPYSTHEVTGNPCQPISLEGEPLHVVSLREYREAGLSKQFFSDVCKEVKLKMAIKKPLHRTRFKPGKMRCQITRILEEGRNGGRLSHQENLAILFEAINAGKSDVEIQGIFRELFKERYDERETSYMISHARRRGYKRFKIATINARYEGENYCLS